jgi:hypothetical protein
MKTYGGADVEIQLFLTSALVGGEWSASLPCRFTPRERAPGTHWIGGWLGPRASLDDVEKRNSRNSEVSAVQPVASRYTDYASRTPNENGVVK